MISVKDLMPDILDQIPVLLYNGQDDVIINTPSAENWIAALEWSGRDEYLKADKTTWKAEGEVAGYARTAKNLTQLVVLKSGHLVTMDQPKYGLDMVRRFINKSGWQ
jgi:carboxypeptidase C (cathepsin A)